MKAVLIYFYLAFTFTPQCITHSLYFLFVAQLTNELAAFLEVVLHSGTYHRAKLDAEIGDYAFTHQGIGKVKEIIACVDLKRELSSALGYASI